MVMWTLKRGNYRSLLYFNKCKRSFLDTLWKPLNTFWHSLWSRRMYECNTPPLPRDNEVSLHRWDQSNGRWRSMIANETQSAWLPDKYWKYESVRLHVAYNRCFWLSARVGVEKWRRVQWSASRPGLNETQHYELSACNQIWRHPSQRL